MPRTINTHSVIGRMDTQKITQTAVGVIKKSRRCEYGPREAEQASQLLRLLINELETREEWRIADTIRASVRKCSDLHVIY